MILGEIVLCEGIEDLRIGDVTCCVWGKDSSIGPHISNTQTIYTWQLSAGDENLIPTFFTIIILWDMADAIPYLVPNQVQESIFPSITRKKIPAQDIQYKQYTH
jgi:hypothetical protein